MTKGFLGVEYDLSNSIHSKMETPDRRTLTEITRPLLFHTFRADQSVDLANPPEGQVYLIAILDGEPSHPIINSVAEELLAKGYSPQLKIQGLPEQGLFAIHMTLPKEELS